MKRSVARRSSNPIRRIRRWLTDIERHSATRPGGPWRRATEYALVASLPVAVTLSVFLDDLGVTVDRDRSVRFRVGLPTADAAPTATRIQPEYEHRPWAMTVPLGTVVVERRVVRKGWPFASVVEKPPPRLLMTPILAPEASVALADAERVAEIEAVTGISTDGVDRAVLGTLDDATSLSGLADEIRADRTTSVRSWGATIVAGGAIWLLLFVASAVAIRGMQLNHWILGRARRRRTIRRLRAGRCPDCLYDLHTERFPKRCPECGRRIWS